MIQNLFKPARRIPKLQYYSQYSNQRRGTLHSRDPSSSQPSTSTHVSFKRCNSHTTAFNFSPHPLNYDIQNPPPPDQPPTDQSTTISEEEPPNSSSNVPVPFPAVDGYGATMVPPPQPYSTPPFDTHRFVRRLEKKKLFRTAQAEDLMNVARALVTDRMGKVRQEALTKKDLDNVCLFVHLSSFQSVNIALASVSLSRCTLRATNRSDNVDKQWFSCHQGVYGSSA
jgi:hypothetical protein